MAGRRTKDFIRSERSMRPEKHAAPHAVKPAVNGGGPVNPYERFLWWGEATDEPARGDARPTDAAHSTTRSTVPRPVLMGSINHILAFEPGGSALSLPLQRLL